MAGIDDVTRKYSFEPTCSGHLRIEYEWTGRQWCELGCEPVEAVAIEINDAVIELWGNSDEEGP